MKNLKFPSAQTILFIIAGLVTLLTWFVPAGKYDTLSYDSSTDKFTRLSLDIETTLPASQASLDELNIKIPIEKFTNGDIYKPINIPATYHQLESKPQSFFDFVKSPIKGIIEAADIIFLVLIIGGLIGVLNRSGAFDAAIAQLAEALKGREAILIVLVTTLVALGGTTFGFAEETIAFYPILIPVFIAARYDAIVAIACIFLGSSIGTMCSTINPFSTIIASDAAGISWTTGLVGRVFMFFLCLTITILYIIRYAKRIQNDPSKSLIYDQRDEISKMFSTKDTSNIDFNWRLKLALLVFTSCFVLMIIGVSILDWWFVEMTTVFLIGAIIIGIIVQISEMDFIDTFVKGAGDLLGVALIIGIARGVTVLMTEGLLSDTLLYYASDLTTGMNKGIFAGALTMIYSGLSFFIPSSSGMAVLTMPIMAPLADTVGVGREIVVNTYQYGLGLFALLNPTGLILASLAVARINFSKWLKFILPLFIILIIVTLIVLAISSYL
ncbi:putative ion transporter superfamily protein YfcC [Winogradskyella epiphytica]|uniref:Putative ion transporter superfamily protein YfcC n=1 Tax=Winogradskyella epiphytica TaxID=262005 RepID=A0A2V4XEV9_9FLAO|nr:YfcC family protein [Winogradskyella epiphytica]PYE81595.1 putative ion transporter superfamily protein YfcC [Winogradskyella epiphytica]GGW64000.1 C4-dicarboxylate transporter [Winogradskyella epiphytica]